jgi:hypothetical protein
MKEYKLQRPCSSSHKSLPYATTAALLPSSTQSTIGWSSFLRSTRRVAPSYTWSKYLELKECSEEESPGPFSGGAVVTSARAAESYLRTGYLQVVNYDVETPQSDMFVHDVSLFFPALAAFLIWAQRGLCMKQPVRRTSAHDQSTWT